MKKIKKYVVMDIVTGVVLCILAGFFVFIMNRLNIRLQKIRLWLEIFTTITGSIYLTLILSRIKKRDFEHKKERQEIKKILCLSLVVVAVRLFNTALYPVIVKWGEIPAAVLSSVMDLAGIAVVYHLLSKKPDAEEDQPTPAPADNG